MSSKVQVIHTNAQQAVISVDDPSIGLSSDEAAVIVRDKSQAIVAIIPTASARLVHIPSGD